MSLCRTRFGCMGAAGGTVWSMLCRMVLEGFDDAGMSCLNSSTYGR
jgi:hypothetical protein